MAQTDGMNPDVRVSDAERDAVVTELGQHFQDGRLDQDEFGDRMAAALAARTRGSLDELLVDLPRPVAARRPAAQPADSAPDAPAELAASSGWRRARPLAVVPILFAAVLIGSLIAVATQHGWHWPLGPLHFLWLIVPALLIRARIRSRGRQWR